MTCKYCGEKLISHEEKGSYNGTAFDVGTEKLYEDLYYKITEKKEMYVFIDGNLAAQITTALGFESAFDLFLGGATYSGNGKGDTLKVQQFFGAIDDFKVYDYGTEALTYSK